MISLASSLAAVVNTLVLRLLLLFKALDTIKHGRLIARQRR
jgi:hypothetical protein